MSPEAAPAKPTCVVIDTNIWRSELLLNTAIGRSLLYTLDRSKSVIGLPEVVELELPSQIVECGRESAADLDRAARMLGTLTGTQFSHNIPSKSDFEEVVAARLKTIEPLLVRVAFNLDHAREALGMLIAKLPPNGEKNQQFKDSAIWQAVLTLARDYTVHFVTNDRAFCRDKTSSKVLAQNLADDCASIGATVHVHWDISSCLRELTSDIPKLDEQHISSLILPLIMPPLEAEATRARVTMGKYLKSELNVFRTAVTGRFAIDYTITLDFLPWDIMKDRYTHVVTVHGSCYYEQGTDSLTANYLQRSKFLWKSESGYTSRLSAFPYEDPESHIPRHFEPM